MRIVYVEDNQANVFLVKRVARMGGHDIINYIDGEEALSNITRDQPNLILMDIQLAGEMSGLQVVEKLREDGFEKPIIAVTAYAMVGDRERCLTAGCNDYIAKPLSIPLLIELMDYYNGKAAGGKPETEAPAATEAASTAAPIMPAPLQAAPQINGTGVHTAAAAVIPAAPPSTPTPAPAPQPATPSVTFASAPVQPIAVPESQTTAPVTPLVPAEPSSSDEFVEESDDTVVGPAAVVSTAVQSAREGEAEADKTDDSDIETKILTAIERRPEASQPASASPSSTSPTPSQPATETRSPEETRSSDDQSATVPSREVSESATKS